MSQSIYDIIDYKWVNASRKVSGYDNQIDYFVNERASDEEEQFIDELFAEIDEMTGLTFTKVDHYSKSDINLFPRTSEYYEEHAGKSWSMPENWDGRARYFANKYWFTPEGERNHFAFATEWRNDEEELTEKEKTVIAHEIGHTLGFGEIAWNPNYTNEDSVMSYNWTGTYQGFTDLDYAALQHLYGV